MKNNNKGFSYVELILVLAIMALMVGMVALSYSYVTSHNVSKSAAKMESAFNSARVTSLSKGTTAGALNIMQKDGIVYYSIGEYDPDNGKVPEWIKIAQTPVFVTRVHGQQHSDIPDGQVITYTYNPSSGAFVDCPNTEFIFSNGKTEATLVLYKRTGKCEVK